MSTDRRVIVSQAHIYRITMQATWVARPIDVRCGHVWHLACEESSPALLRSREGRT